MSDRVICTQPQCLLRDGQRGLGWAADWIIRLLSGETIEGASEVSLQERIRDRSVCRGCALDVMHERGPLPTEEEWEGLEDGRRSHRRARRAQRRRSA
jgi:hypothetical protein